MGAISSYGQAVGFTVLQWLPAWTTGVLQPKAAALADMRVTGYKHTISALGGYVSCGFALGANLALIEEWLQSGIGRHIEVYDDAAEMIWEGYVNQVDVNVSGLSVTHGPLLDCANRVRIGYSTMDTTTKPPTTGERIFTAYVNNVLAQARYGIIVKDLSTGGATAAMAAQICSQYLAENAWPPTTKQFSNTGGALSLSVSCVGYNARMNYAYNQTTVTGQQDLSVKLAAILNADPNALFSSANATITTNTLQVKAYENDDQEAWSLIKSLVARGDATYNRYLFGVYANRKAVYAAAPTEIGYYQRLSATDQRIETRDGAEVEPWRVLPGKWLLFPDFLVGSEASTTTLRQDPRAMFIESVSYTAPWGVQLSGSKSETLSQRLAQLGLSGIGA